MRKTCVPSPREKGAEAVGLSVLNHANQKLCMKLPFLRVFIIAGNGVKSAKKKIALDLRSFG